MQTYVRKIIIDGVVHNAIKINDLDFGPFLICKCIVNTYNARYTIISSKRDLKDNDVTLKIESSISSNASLFCKKIKIKTERYILLYEKEDNRLIPYAHYFGISLISGFDKNGYLVGEIQKSLNHFLFFKNIQYKQLERLYIDNIELRRNRNNILISSLKEFDDACDSYNRNKADDEAIFYRGQDSFLYGLVPTLYRKHNNYKYEYEYGKLYEKFCSKYFSNKNTIEKLAIMQHYGIPTRLLDITTDRYVALYFACLDNKNTRGSVFIFNIKNSDVKNYNNPEVQVLAHLSTLTYNEKNELYKKILKNESVSSLDSYKKLFRGLNEEVINSFNPKILFDKLYVKSSSDFDRILSQNGNFVLLGLSKESEVEKFDNFNRVPQLNPFLEKKILIINKQKILRELANIGYTKETIFPNLEKISRIVKKKINEQS